jgi:hypothetical protein
MARSLCGEPSRARRRLCDLYIGCWRKHARVAKGQRIIARFEDAKTESTRSFCSRCGTPMLYERKRSPQMVNIPRALFTSRTGREPRYHVAIEELQDWAYTGKPLVPLKGYPGIVWERSKSRKRPRDVDHFEILDRRITSALAMTPVSRRRHDPRAKPGSFAGFYGFGLPRAFSGSMHDCKSRAHARISSDSPIGPKTDGLDGGAEGI